MNCTHPTITPNGEVDSIQVTQNFDTTGQGRTTTTYGLRGWTLTLRCGTQHHWFSVARVVETGPHPKTTYEFRDLCRAVNGLDGAECAFRMAEAIWQRQQTEEATQTAINMLNAALNTGTTAGSTTTPSSAAPLCQAVACSHGCGALVAP